MAEKPHAHSLRVGRYSQPGQIYLLTTITQKRKPVFENWMHARQLIHILKEQQERDHARTLAFVVMPDHLHWLMQLGDVVTLSTCMRNVKTLSALRIGKAIWQPGFHDHALRSEEDLAGIARYVVANPVRAGLVQKTGQYSHWDAIWV